jgi:hypothetical protein
MSEGLPFAEICGLIRPSIRKTPHESAHDEMTEKDDPSRVAFGGNGNGGRDLPLLNHTGNGAEGNGAVAKQELFSPVPPVFRHASGASSTTSIAA